MNIADGKITAGIDVGSRTTKVVLWDGEKIVDKTIISTGWSPAESSKNVLRSVKKSSGIAQFNRIIITGFGRITAPEIADEAITEITAHAKGISRLLPETRTIIDIGGQDSKAILIDDGGLVQDFAMNDRCAAGSGKFLEFLAKSLEISIDKFAETGLKSDRPVRISSMCTVFAESEILSMLAEGAKREDVAAGVHRSIAQRVAVMAKSLQPESPVSFTGGVAKNKCMIREMSIALNVKISVPEIPEFTGALGAAIIAYERI